MPLNLFIYHSNFLLPRHFYSIVSRRKSWALPWRGGSVLQGLNTNNTVESMMMVIKDNVLNRSVSVLNSLVALSAIDLHSMHKSGSLNLILKVCHNSSVWANSSNLLCLPPSVTEEVYCFPHRHLIFVSSIIWKVCERPFEWYYYLLILLYY